MSRRWAWSLLGSAAALLVLVLAGLALLGSVPGAKGQYANGDPQLAVSYRAKETCSCVFVLERDERYCRAWTEASPDVASVEVDLPGKAVTSRALCLWSARARFVDAKHGCVIE